MRPVLHGDVCCAARALLAAAPEDRGALCRQILNQAWAADRYRRRHGRLHPRWGNGSLMAAARKHPMADEPGFDDPGYRHCFVMVLRALGARLSPRRS
ncbi:hypothetical protein [Antarcticimicrobium luteum]|uniref:DUF7742 domain-containing protein n=1 Tax=Antarcticimicrobium luteum TaxID=2547397 RepID=A0A4V6PM94_9RHOB|nr:hypothetical protein [Antarcticimicrobium luteum]TDK49847.1 hypothetical protein E1832_08170 [Antarcticimicrobium luteum]